MENISWVELHKLLESKNKELNSIKTELISVKQQVLSLETRFKEVVGEPPSEKKELESRLKEVVGHIQIQSIQDKTLRQCVFEILNNSNEPLTVAEIAELVLEAGYKTSSKNGLRGMVQKALGSDEFHRVTKPNTRPSRYALEADV